MITLLNIIFLLLIVFVIWWFWLSKSKAQSVDSGVVAISIKDGVYVPNRVQVSADKDIVLEFTRIDKSPCSEQVVFSELDVHESIAIDAPHQIKLGKLDPGNYKFGCQMNMYQGELIVK